MADTLATFFSLGGLAIPLQSYFYTLLKDQPNSVECHKVLAKLFAQALGLSSYRFRKVPNVPYASSMIPDENTLNLLLPYLAPEIQAASVQVLFEQINMQPGPANCVKFPTSVPATKASLRASVDMIRVWESTNFYNEVRLPYTFKPWALQAKPELPPALPIATLSSTPDGVATALTTLADWITTSDPDLVFMRAQLGLTAQQIITNVFAPSQNALFAFDFMATLLNRIRAAGSKEKVENNALARNAFIKVVRSVVGDAASFWQTEAVLKPWAAQIMHHKAARLSTDYAILFEQTRALFLAGLEVPLLQAQTKTAIIALLNQFNDAGNASQVFLGKKLGLAAAALLKCINADPEALVQAAIDVKADVQDFIDTGMIEELMKAVGSALSSIPLVPTAQFVIAPIAEVRLFAFTAYSTISQEDRVSYFPHGVEPKNTDLIYVPDASEAGQAFSRPTYNAISVDDNDDPGLKFFNVGGESAAAFFFGDAGQPSRVVSSGPPMLIFDFVAATINGTSAVPAGGLNLLPGYLPGTPYKTTGTSGSSSTVFYDVVRTFSKWTSLSGQRSYDALYETRSVQQVLTHLTWRLPPGGGLSRAEAVDPDLVLWEWHGAADSKYPRIGEFLDLPLSRRIQRAANSPLVTIGTDQYTLASQDRQYQGMLYRFIGIAKVGAATEYYVLTNTPHDNIPAAFVAAVGRPHPSRFNPASLTILRDLNFSYYRKVDFSNVSSPKVIKRIASDGSPKRPHAGDAIVLSTQGKITEIGISLPISFRIEKNLALFKTLTGANGALQPSMKNKGRALYRTTGDRTDAGAVMKGLLSYLKTPPVPKAGLPATLFGDWVIATSKMAGPSWVALKVNNRSKLPTNQEWCHILGHGDGGDERLGNFVGGSFHCNSEQLAIESGQRITTQSLPRGTFFLMSTAYLFKNEDGLVLANYLQSDLAYNATLAIRNQLKTKEGRAPSKNTGAGTNIPLAGFFRYKVERDIGNDTRVKVFEHIFEGQGEFMDVHQFKILSKTAELVIGGEAALARWYASEDPMTDTTNDA